MLIRPAPLRAGALTTALFLVAIATTCAATPPQTVTAQLEDPSTGPSVERMQIVLDHHTVKAGRVTLHAINRSKKLVHEVLVLRDPGQKALPYARKENEVDEHRIHSLGEVGDLPPGHSGTLTVDLAPGTYLLFCNEPGHYAEGMKTTLTVTP